jgi:hypothetical protein
VILLYFLLQNFRDVWTIVQVNQCPCTEWVLWDWSWVCYTTYRLHCLIALLRACVFIWLRGKIIWENSDPYQVMVIWQESSEFRSSCCSRKLEISTKGFLANICGFYGFRLRDAFPRWEMPSLQRCYRRCPYGPFGQERWETWKVPIVMSQSENNGWHFYDQWIYNHQWI